MKPKIFVFATLSAALAVGAALAIRYEIPRPGMSAMAPVAPAARKVLYYQSAMHPWIKSDKPGKCPICGMDLVPVYESETDTNSAAGIRLKPGSVAVLNVQTAAVTRRAITHTLRVAGTISDISRTKARFEFTVYGRDLAWIKTGQPVTISRPDAPGKTWSAIIQPPVGTAAGKTNFDPASDSLTLTAELAHDRAPAEDSGVISGSGQYAEGAIRAETQEVLAAPRSAVLSPGGQPVVYVDAVNGHYEARPVKLGRIGDDYVEVLHGLQEQEKVVSEGNLLIDAETQISRSDTH